ncbi:O-acyltransferase WSD1-like [Phalaenopsis equestris]|uniref:O-acyltransferase WSD1-like n=1 Tax=Phalaenopsis equestris TaxID=78828 RepID=UPI0009E1E4F0|nr:O-acyltransferase WSD1-like [Phalaenopsis equestris]
MHRKNPLAVKIPSLRFISPATEEEMVAATAGKGIPLSPAANFFRQPRFDCHIITILGLGKFIGAEEMKAGLEATLVRHPRFSSVQVTDKSGRDTPRWVPTKVNLDDHVIYPDVGTAATAAAVDPVAGDRFVEDYIAGLSHSRLDTSRPLWEIHVLAIRTSEAASVAIFRIHHSLGDGVSLMSLFLACTRRTSDNESLPSLPSARRRSTAAGTGFGPCVLLSWIWSFLVYTLNSFVHSFLFVASAFFLKDTRTRIMGSEGVEFRPKRCVHRTLSLDDIKDIKNAMGCTINDVLVGVTSAALTRYLSRGNEGLLPKNIRIRTSLLVNIRPTTGIQSLAEMMKKGSAARWGNQMGYILLRFPVMKCDDPLDYIRKGTAAVEKKKKSWEAIFTHLSALLIVKTLGIKVGTDLCHRVVSNTSLSFSNLVGPTEEVGFCGVPLVYIAPSVYGHPQALTVHFQSYINKMKAVLSVDELVIPNPHELLDDISYSLQLIRNAVMRH